MHCVANTFPSAAFVCQSQHSHLCSDQASDLIVDHVKTEARLVSQLFWVFSPAAAHVAIVARWPLFAESVCWVCTCKRADADMPTEGPRDPQGKLQLAADKIKGQAACKP